MAKRRRYTAQEFDRAASTCRMEADSVALARAVLVDGASAAAVAAAQEVSRQWVSLAAKKMRNYIEQANPVPQGWKSDLVTLPNADWPKVRMMERLARSRVTIKKRGL